MLQNDGLYHSDEVCNNYFGSRPHQAPTNLAKHFPVIITPEASTSKTCFFCDGMRSAVAHKTMRREHMNKEGKESRTEIRSLHSRAGCHETTP